MTKYHNILVSYFSKKPFYLDNPGFRKPNIRKLVEQPWQQTKAEMWDEVTETLCNLEFIQAKAAARMTYELIDDFNLVLQIIPDNAENIRKEHARQTRLDKYAKDLELYAKGEISELEVPQSIKPWSEEKINAEIERIKNNPTRLDRINVFCQFIGEETSVLQEYASELPGLVFQEAWNNFDSGPVADEASHIVRESSGNLFLFKNCTRLVWNPEPLTLARFAGRSALLTPDSRFAFSQTEKDEFILFDIARRKPLKFFKGNDLEITAFSYSHRSNIAFAGSNTGTCICWDTNTGKIKYLLEGHLTSIDFNPTVNTVALSVDGSFAISGSQDRTLIVWDLESGSQLKVLRGHTDHIVTAAISDDGKQAMSGSLDRTCILWDIKTGNIIRSLSVDGYVLSVKFNSRGKIIISSRGELWDMESGKLLMVPKLAKPVNCIDMTPDGNLGIAGVNDNSCFLWDIETGKILKKYFGHSAPVLSVSISPDGTRALSSSTDGTTLFWNPETGTELPGTEKSEGHRSRIQKAQFTMDGKYAISASEDNTNIKWESQSGKKIRNLHGTLDRLLSISPQKDANYAISATSDNTHILWNMDTGIVIRPLKGHTANINAAVITKDGSRIATVSDDNRFILWNPDKEKPEFVFRDIKEPIKAVAVTSDSHRYVFASIHNLVILDLETGGSEGSRFMGLLKSITQGSSSARHIRSQQYRTFFVGGSNQFKLSPDEKTLAICCVNCTMTDIETGNTIRTLNDHRSDITSVAFTNDSKYAVTGSLDKTVILWDLATGRKIGQLFLKEEVRCLDLFNNDLIVGGNSGKPYFVDIVGNMTRIYQSEISQDSC